MYRPLRFTFLLALLLTVLLASCGPPVSYAYENGKLPGSALSQANTGFRCDGNGDQLSNAAAAAYNTAALAAGKPLPSNGCQSLYRDYAGQVAQRAYWCGQGLCGNAAVPGTSGHGWGDAADVAQWVRGYFDSTAGAYGFDKRCSDAPHEWWHLRYCRSFDRPNPGTSLKFPTLRKGSGGPGQAAYVKRAQKRLRDHGQRQVKADGDFGKVTAHAVKRFQKAHKLKPDGIVGKRTWRQLLKPPARNGGGEGKPPKPPKPPNKDEHGPKDKLPTKTIRGIDVSMHNGEVGWGKVRKAGARFAIVKATEGEDYTDPWFTDNRLRAIEKAGIVPGVYHYLRPRSDRPGAREATFFAEEILERGYGRGFLPPVLDIEETTLGDEATCTYLRSAVTRLERVLDVRPILYTYPSFVAEHLAGCSWMGNYRLWLASYGPKDPPAPAPWKRWLMHQYTGAGSIRGVAGDVDLNRLPGGVRKLERIRIDKLPKRLSEPKRARALAPRAIPAPVTKAVVAAEAAANPRPRGVPTR